MLEQRDFFTARPNQLPEMVDALGLEEALQRPGVGALLTYFQRYFPMKIQRALNAHFAPLLESADSLPFLDALPEHERRWFMENCDAIQLTYGCNGGCEFCGFDAVPGKRESLPFPLVENLLRTYAHELRETSTGFFYASDPLDYRWTNEQGDTKTYVDVAKLAKEIVGYEGYISTVVPHGSEDVLWKLVDEKIAIDRISVKNQRHLLQLNLKGMLGLGKNAVEIEYHVPVGNLGLYGEGKTNEETPWHNKTGIGCFNGTLVTPRGIYCVAQNPGIDPATPQRQFVVPYLGADGRLPEVDDDVREVLAHNVPFLDHSFAVHDVFPSHGIDHDARDEYSFLIRSSSPEHPGAYLITHKGTMVTQVENCRDYHDVTMLYAREKFVQRGNRVPMGLGYACTMAKYATDAAEEAALRQPPDEGRIEDYVLRRSKIGERRAVMDILFSNPAWVMAYVRLYRKHYPDALISFDPAKENVLKP